MRSKIFKNRKRVANLAILFHFLILFYNTTTWAWTDADAFKETVRKLEANQGDLNLYSVIGYNINADRYELWSYPLKTIAKKLEINLNFSTPPPLENSDFKVIMAESNQTALLNDFDGRNVLFHLMYARNYFLKLDPKNPVLNRKLIVRVHMDKEFNEETHFGSRSLRNRSGYFPAHYLGAFDNEFLFYRQGTYINLPAILISSALSLLNLPYGPLISVPISLNRNKNQGFDSARQPYSIYHEAFHWVTDRPGYFQLLRNGAPVAEDYATYFGASILGQHKTHGLESYSDSKNIRDLTKIKKIKKSSGRPEIDYNTARFIPTIFWKIRQWIGADEADRLIYQTIPLVGNQGFPSDVALALRKVFENHPQSQKVFKLLDNYECSFFDANSYFEYYYKEILGKASPVPPQKCNN